MTFWQKHHERSLSLFGEEGCLFWNQDDDLLIEKYFNNADNNVKHVNSNSDNDSMFDLQIKSFIENMNTLDSSVNMNDSISSMTIIEAAKKSMQENTVVSLDIS